MSAARDARQLLDSYERNEALVLRALQKAGLPSSWFSVWGRTLRRLVTTLEQDYKEEE